MTEAITLPKGDYTNYNRIAARALRLFIQPTSFFSHSLMTTLVALVAVASILSGSAGKVLSATHADTQISEASLPLAVASLASAGGLQVPVSQDSAPMTALATADTGFLRAPSAPTTDMKASLAPTIYAVKAGETIAQIAAAHGISPETILWANGLTRGASVKAGQTLKLLPVSGVLYEASGGETLDQLAKRFHSNVSDIIAANAVDQDAPIPAGTQIVVPGGVKELAGGSALTGVPTTQVAVNSGGANSFPYGYCTYWVASKRSIPWLGNAWQWYGNAKAMGYPVGKTPQVGAIYVSWESYIGHVGYVESVGDDGSYTISEMNYAGWGVVDHRTISSGSAPLIGFIY